MNDLVDDLFRRTSGHIVSTLTRIPAALDAVPPPGAHLRGEPAMPDDDRLAMMFLACHPSLPREARVALTLKIVCAFGVGEIARALLSGGCA